MRLRIIGLIVTLAVGLLLAPLAADAQQTGNVARIGILCVGICPILPLDVTATCINECVT